MRDTFIEWLILINIITFVIYALDKYKAVHHLWRIPEKTLIFLAIIGGSPAALLAMYTIRHKTRHIKFTLDRTISDSGLLPGRAQGYPHEVSHLPESAPTCSV